MISTDTFSIMDIGLSYISYYTGVSFVVLVLHPFQDSVLHPIVQDCSVCQMQNLKLIVQFCTLLSEISNLC